MTETNTTATGTASPPMGPASTWTTSAQSERAAYLAVALSPGIGIGRLHSILNACSTPLGALSAPYAFLCTVPGLSRPAATALAARTLADGERVLVEAARLGAIALLPDDALFPASLREIQDAPPVLFARGRLDLLAR